MGIRADLTLQLQLEQVKKETSLDDVRETLDDALKHMLSGSRGNRKGGRKLIGLLARGRSEAARGQEWSVVRLLQDSLDYAEGRILQPDFEDRYRLFQEGRSRSTMYRDWLSSILRTALEYSIGTSRKFIDESPGSTAEDLLSHFEELRKESPFLDAPDDRPGRYRILKGRAEMATWIERMMLGQIDIEDPQGAARKIATSPEALAVLANDKHGHLILHAAELKRRSSGLKKLRAVATDPTATEADLQRVLEGQYWIFGGRFVGEAAQRRLVPGDEIDIPLIRGDGSLHIVELKRAAGAQHSLVKRHRNAWIPTSEVHNAVGQAINYLVGLDENRKRIHSEFGIETRRASAVVLVGYPDSEGQASESEVNETLRILNTHMGRVEVITYKELIDNAERVLASV